MPVNLSALLQALKAQQPPLNGPAMGAPAPLNDGMLGGHWHPSQPPVSLGDVGGLVGGTLADAVQGVTGWRPGTTPSWMPQSLVAASDANKAAAAANAQALGKYGFTPQDQAIAMGFTGPDIVSSRPGINVIEHPPVPYEEGTEHVIEATNANGNPVGRISYTRYKGAENAAGITDIWTHPDAHRQGIASALMDRIAQKFGYQNIHWGVRTESGAALKAALDAKYGVNTDIEGVANQQALLKYGFTPEDAGIAMGFAGPTSEATGVKLATDVRTPADINPNQMHNLGPVYRGTETGPNAQQALRQMQGGDLGDATYVTPDKELAASYGGGPKASVKRGTRTVHSYDTNPLYPEEVAYAFGGLSASDPFHVVSGNGIPLYEGPWTGGTGKPGSPMEAALAQHEGLKAVVGTPDSIGVNQIAVRDPSILRSRK